MYEDFLSARLRITSSMAYVVQPFDWASAKSGECCSNVAKAIETFGGSICYGWALAGVGPRSVSDRDLPPLYQRWVNHALWHDKVGRLWEVTPASDVFDPKIIGWLPTLFVPDAEATFEATPGGSSARPSIYIAVRPEGEEAADCLCRAERASSALREDLLDLALASIEQGGFTPKKWTMETTGDRIKNIWLVAE
jgi:hypothetical protein